MDFGPPLNRGVANRRKLSPESDLFNRIRKGSADARYYLNKGKNEGIKNQKYYYTSGEQGRRARQRSYTFIASLRLKKLYRDLITLSDYDISYRGLRYILWVIFPRFINMNHRCIDESSLHICYWIFKHKLLSVSLETDHTIVYRQLGTENEEQYFVPNIFPKQPTLNWSRIKPIGMNQTSRHHSSE